MNFQRILPAATAALLVLLSSNARPQQCPVGGSIGVGFQIPQTTVTAPPTTPPSTDPSNPPTSGGGGGGSGNPSDPNNQIWGTCNGSPVSSNGLMRMDSDKVNPKYSAYLGQDNSFQSPVQTFSDVWGSNDPADVPSGQSAEFYLTLGCYVSLEFTPMTEGKVTFSANASYGSGGAYSVSTSPGGFDSSTALTGGNCLMTYGGLNNLGMIITSPGEEVANPAIAGIPGCHLEIGKTYYLNISPDNGGTGCNTSASQSCAVALQMQVVKRSWANYNPLG